MAQFIMKDLSTKYSDATGVIHTNMMNDGEEVLVLLEGTFFASTNLFDLKPKYIDKPTDRFVFDKDGLLTNYTLAVKFPMQTNKCEDAVLKVQIKAQLSEEGINQKKATFQVALNNDVVEIGEFDEFETAFNKINKIMTSRLTCCFNCLYSDYSVYGQDSWGTMFCYKNNKSNYLEVETKTDYREIMDDHDGLVQETFYCEEFKKRVKGTGYRG